MCVVLVLILNTHEQYQILITIRKVFLCVMTAFSVEYVHRRFGVTYCLFLQKNLEVRKVFLIHISTNVPDCTMSLLCKRQTPHLEHTLRYSLFDTLRLLRQQRPLKGLSD